MTIITIIKFLRKYTRLRKIHKSTIIFQKTDAISMKNRTGDQSFNFIAGLHEDAAQLLNLTIWPLGDGQTTLSFNFSHNPADKTSKPRNQLN